MTLSQIQVILERYVPQHIPFLTYLNLACERILKSGKWKDTRFTAFFRIYDDLITTPENVASIDRAILLPDDLSSTSQTATQALEIYSEWYQFANSGSYFENSNNADLKIIQLGGEFCTFRNIGTPSPIEVRSIASETGTIRICGLDQSLRTIRSADGSEGIELDLSTTPCRTPDSVPFHTITKVIKSKTTSPVALFTVSNPYTNQIAEYSANETFPNYQRYKVTGSDANVCLALCTRAFIPIQFPNDTVYPSNANALKVAFQALHLEDENDFDRAEKMWQKVFTILSLENIHYNSDAVNRRVQVEYTGFQEKIYNII